MELSFTGAHDRFRDEVRAFFDTALTDELRAARRFMTSVYCDYDTGMKWQRILLDKGWLVPSWPVGIRRHRLDDDATLHLQLRTRAREPAAGVADGARDARPRPARLRHAGTARLLSAAHAARRGLLVSGLFRTAGRLGPRRSADRRGGRRRRLHRQRHQDLDHARALREPHVLPGAYRALRAPADGRHVPAARHEGARREHAADPLLLR